MDQSLEELDNPDVLFENDSPLESTDTNTSIEKCKTLIEELRNIHAKEFAEFKIASERICANVGVMLIQFNKDMQSVLKMIENFIAEQKSALHNLVKKHAQDARKISEKYHRDLHKQITSSQTLRDIELYKEASKGFAQSAYQDTLHSTFTGLVDLVKSLAIGHSDHGDGLRHHEEDQSRGTPTKDGGSGYVQDVSVMKVGQLTVTQCRSNSSDGDTLAESTPPFHSRNTSTAGMSYFTSTPGTSRSTVSTSSSPGSIPAWQDEDELYFPRLKYLTSDCEDDGMEDDRHGIYERDLDADPDSSLHESENSRYSAKTSILVLSFSENDSMLVRVTPRH